MIILLDIDGVLVTTPPWRAVDQHEDGFMKFNEKAASNLARLISETNASIVLTTTHRINYSVDQWKKLLGTRGIYPASISKVNDRTSIDIKSDRASEIKGWVDKQELEEPFVILDDDLSINQLPPYIKDRCVLTKSMIGLDEESTEKALKILMKL